MDEWMKDEANVEAKSYTQQYQASIFKYTHLYLYIGRMTEGELNP